MCLLILNFSTGFEIVPGSGRLELDCEYNFVNNTAEWDGSPEDLATCQGKKIIYFGLKTTRNALCFCKTKLFYKVN